MATTTTTTTTTMTEVWDTDKLMGKGIRNKEGPKDVALNWGQPGHLTETEAAVFNKFRDEIATRSGEFRETVYCFGEEEGEAFALGRWLRARKFVYQDVIKMVEEATQCRKPAKEKEFYPDPVSALGCESGLFFDQYPQVYSGVAKNGAPVFISKPGILNVDGMECITTLDGIIQFHWHVMMHDFANRLRAQKESDPNFKRFECFCILDLSGLTTSQLSRRSLAIIKEQAAIDSLCFPETMSKMLIVNSPTFFSATWRIIKGWLDPRTSNKVEVISNTNTMHKKLLALVDADQLPCDYGGKGPETSVTMRKSSPDQAGKLSTKVLYLRGHGSETFDVPAGESLDITVYTRSTSGAKFSLFNADTKEALLGGAVLELVHGGTDDTSEAPTTKKMTTEKIVGPIKIKVKADSNANRFSMHNYLLAFSLTKTE